VSGCVRYVRGRGEDLVDKTGCTQAHLHLKGVVVSLLEFAGV